MIQILPSGERGHFDFGWLNTYHSFSFGDYYNPKAMGFRSLRVINEDRVLPSKGFGTHPHKDMEIITVILKGALQHKDSMGNTSVIYPGEVQRMSAGSGVTHSEFNPSPDEEVHLLQIWILPNNHHLKPSYEQKKFLDEEKKNRWCLVASLDGHDNSVTLHQDANLYITKLDAGKKLEHTFEFNRGGWVQVASGSLMLNGQALQVGDGAALTDEVSAKIEAKTDSEILLFDLA